MLIMDCWGQSFKKKREYNFLQQECDKLIKSDIKDIYNVTKIIFKHW